MEVNERKHHILVMAPVRHSKAYPYGKGVGTVTPSSFKCEYNSEKDWLNSFKYSELEMKLYDYDRDLFFDYIHIKYDKYYANHYSKKRVKEILIKTDIAFGIIIKKYKNMKYRLQRLLVMMKLILKMLKLPD